MHIYLIWPTTTECWILFVLVTYFNNYYNKVKNKKYILLITEVVGNTPIVRLKKIEEKIQH